MKRYLSIGVLLIILLNLLIIGCEYNSDLIKLYQTDLLQETDMTTDWLPDRGVGISLKDEFYLDDKQLFELSLGNMIENGEFEDSVNSNDLNNWRTSIEPPDVFEVLFDSKMSGNNYMMLDLKRDTGVQLIYHEFDVVGGRDYIFRFAYKYILGWSLQLSHGDGVIEKNIELTLPSKTSINTAFINIPIYTDNPVYQVRIGYTQNTMDTQNFAYYFDDMAFFEDNDAAIYKYILINDSTDNPNDLTDDGISQTIRSGKYRFSIYARQQHRGYLTIQFGGLIKTFELTDQLEQYYIDNNIYDSDKSIKLSVSPVNSVIYNKYPSKIVITKPELRLFQ